ncbi:MAG TPA: ABC transporter ATP-binding protein [Chloroflexota bacterium]
MSATVAAPLRLCFAAEHSVAQLEDVTKVYGHGPTAVTALQDVSFAVGRSEFVCILGASGCGKSTLLTLLAGLDRVSRGNISIGVAQPSLMFQEPALLPWLTVRRNIELPLRLKHLDNLARQRVVNRLLNMVGLIDFADHRPHQISGGMAQRAALARALAHDSELLLMDEPFAALDAITRDQLHDDLNRIWEETGKAIVFVTHNVREAVRLGDRVILLTTRPGRVGRVWDVDIPRPRELDSIAVASLATEITAWLRLEMGHAEE